MGSDLGCRSPAGSRGDLDDYQLDTSGKSDRVAAVWAVCELGFEATIGTLGSNVSCFGKSTLGTGHLDACWQFDATGLTSECIVRQCTDLPSNTRHATCHVLDDDVNFVTDCDEKDDSDDPDQFHNRTLIGVGVYNEWTPHESIASNEVRYSMLSAIRSCDRNVRERMGSIASQTKQPIGDT